MKKNIIIKILLNNNGFVWWIPLVAAAVNNAMNSSDNPSLNKMSSALSFINFGSKK